MLEQIHILGVHYHLSDSAKTFIREKLSKLAYLDRRIVDGTLRVIHERKSYRTEIDIHFNHGARIHLHADHMQLYPAIENLMHKLKKYVAEEKAKIKDYHRHHMTSVHHGGGHPTEK